jgi:hypothetical protein
MRRQGSSVGKNYVANEKTDLDSLGPRPLLLAASTLFMADKFCQVMKASGVPSEHIRGFFTFNPQWLIAARTFGMAPK